MPEGAASLDSLAPLALVRTTLPGGSGAALARDIVERRLAACVHVTPLRSVYRWEGALHEDAEDLLEATLPSGGVDALREFLADEHPYDLPAIMVLDAAAETRYARWAAGEVG